MLFHVVKAFAKAMRFGSKYIYQTVPRLLTIWLDISDNPEVLANTTTEKQKREPIIIDVFRDMCQSVEDAIKKVPAYKVCRANLYVDQPLIDSAVVHGIPPDRFAYRLAKWPGLPDALLARL